ncbi:hypothetical protein SCHPADRAFT_591500 [Schizopora paradoxa]|uniref:Uncharacterized protein n=1 Tax=Schizopora paradoxa TaxID=27342 RepID=A0A0H2RAR1_9AGAM|nr:hypothetical protein SCHPADRAFT_591500 [Schizopora paradoxa]
MTRSTVFPFLRAPCSMTMLMTIRTGKLGHLIRQTPSRPRFPRSIRYTLRLHWSESQFEFFFKPRIHLLFHLTKTLFTFANHSCVLFSVRMSNKLSYV